MKKIKTQDQEQKWKPRHLSLNRETIRLLHHPELLELARGGGPSAQNLSNCVDNDSGSCYC